LAELVPKKGDEPPPRPGQLRAKKEREKGKTVGEEKVKVAGKKDYKRGKTEKSSTWKRGQN